MTKNLNYAVEGSKCYAEGEGVSADSIAKNCATYGRLYDWATAMALSSSCNSSSCASQITAKHRGICPSGWHIPSDAEWDALMAAVGGSLNAGTKLKATDGWDDYDDISGNGTDEYGFSALPGGYIEFLSSRHYDVGSHGYWWSSAESEKIAYQAIGRGIINSYNHVSSSYERPKRYMQSVRCMKDDDSSPAGNGGGSVVHGTPVIYEEETYETVVIGSQTWMARNLNYAVEGSRCYESVTDNCTQYGRLYSWATAMALSSSCNSSSCASQVNTKHRGICPIGWHIPSDAEWDALMAAVGGSSTAGTKLKATDGWQENCSIIYTAGNGTDEYGFSALPGGRFSAAGTFWDVGRSGEWWGSVELSANDAIGRTMGCEYDAVPTTGLSWTKRYMRSVRCLKD